MPNYRFLNYELSEADFSLSCEGRRIALEPKALRVLTVLVSRAGRLVDKQELLDTVWPDTFVEDNTLTRTIAILRRELGDSSRESRLIETVPTRGYRFIAEVEVLEAVAMNASPVSSGAMAAQPLTVADQPAAQPAVPNPHGEPPAEAGTEVVPPGPSRLWLWLAVCLALAAAGCLWVWNRRAAAGQPIRSLAVLPLEDLSPGTREDYFADGMTDELITELARIPQLRVVSRTSAMQEKGTRKPLGQIARELQVDAVVEGSVLRSAGRVRITAQLIDARSDRHLWAQSFEGALGDILTLQDDVARDIAFATRSVLTPAMRARFSTEKHVSPEAYDDYLRGLYFMQRRDSDVATQYLQKAIALEPDYAAAYAGLAEALVTKALGNGEAADTIMPPAIAAAKRAMALDANSGESYTALGAIDASYLRNWDEAERNLRKGIELSPSDATAQTWYAIYLTSVGRPAEAVTAVQRAATLDPFSFWVNRLLGSMLYYARRYDEALVALKRAQEIAPDKFEFVEGWNSRVYEMQGRYSEAVAADLKNDGAEFTARQVDTLRSAFSHGGWKAYQQERINLLLPRSTNECYMNPISLSYLRLDNPTEAFRWFHRDLDNHCGITIFDLSSNALLDRYRQDPRFHALLRRVKLAH